MSVQVAVNEAGRTAFSPEDALRLRRWALRALAGGGPRTSWSDAPAASARTWAVFLDTEACAAPLRAALGPPSDAALPRGARAELERRVMQEQKRFLSAHAQARQIARWIAGTGWRVAVLKGGVAAVDGHAPVNVADLDLLALPDVAPALATCLESHGEYVALGEESGHAPAPKHLPQRLAPGGIQVEIHRSIPRLPPACELLARATPLPGLPDLLALAPGDHLWHLLMHGAVEHPERRGSIRELLLLRAALARCTDAERREVEAQSAGHTLAPLLGAVLRAASGVEDGHSDLTNAAAVRYCLVDALGWRGVPRRFARDVCAAAFALVGGRREARLLWSERLAAPAGPRMPDALRGRLSGAGRLVAALWRGGRLATATLSAAALVRRARLAAGRATG